MGPEALAQVLCHLPKFEDENLIVGLDTSDDAAIYKLDEEKSLVLTLDFFTPVVDDPYLFGQIAAANSLSDIYAMGGRPVTAMNICCFPSCLETETIVMILKGGADKMLEAGAILVGGHTVEDEEPKYGLSLMGYVNNNEITPNAGAEVGDILVLTKPLGLGIAITAIKADIASKKLYEDAVEVMKYLNKDSCEVMVKHGIKGATDITGFGLLGHGSEIAEASKVTLEIDSSLIPILDQVKEHALDGIIPAGRYNNEKYLEGKVKFTDNTPDVIKDILFDPQTSGGLLICVKPEVIESFVMELGKVNKASWAIIGKVKKRGEFFVEII